jgi:serine/threonine-protein kinase
VYFRIFEPWQLFWFGEAKPQAAGGAGTSLTFLSSLQRYLFMAVVVGGIFVIALAALRNIRLGRADRRTALRLGMFVLVLVGLWKTLEVSHYSSFNQELGMVLAVLMTAGFSGVAATLAYLAGEPYLRKLWPDCLVSSTRLAIGQWKDPRIGRDILVGTAFGVGSVILYQLAVLLPTIFGMPIRQPLVGASLAGGRLALAEFLDPGFVTMSFGGGIALLLILLLVRRKSLALGIAFVIYAVAVTDADLSHLSQPAQLAVFVADTLGVALMWIGFARFGFLTVVAGLGTYQRLLAFPVTLDSSAWYAGTSTLVIIALAAIAFYGFRMATANQSTQKIAGLR